MDENNYRSTYHSVNPLQCPFERTLNSRRCTCRKMIRFNLADREGVACQSKVAHLQCLDFLEVIRRNAIFALKMTHIDAPLPHGKEIKVQNGSILGLRHIFSDQNTDISNKPDIYTLITKARDIYTEFENLPLNELMPFIVNFKARKTRKE